MELVVTSDSGVGVDGSSKTGIDVAGTAGTLGGTGIGVSGSGSDSGVVRSGNVVGVRDLGEYLIDNDQEFGRPLNLVRMTNFYGDNFGIRDLSIFHNCISRYRNLSQTKCRLGCHRKTLPVSSCIIV